ncbi:hypothetical protein ZWY2020_055471 [Hordeum vulgare]|nr:hypothetical protein ZWY2020_055471 [Hordeum vulgare]
MEEPVRFHETTKVITLGDGAVGWVDLWHGMLICNVFDERPMLRDVPLPLPARDAIKYVEVEICLPSKALTKTTKTSHSPESYLEWFQQQQCKDDDDDEDHGGWKATMWSLPVPIASWEDWHLDYTVDVDDLTVDPMHCKLLPMPLTTEAEALLPRLITAFPIMGMDDDVVYLLSKANPKDQMEVVIAVDVKKLQGVAKLVTGKDFTSMRSCTSLGKKITTPLKFSNLQLKGPLYKCSLNYVALVKRFL